MLFALLTTNPERLLEIVAATPVWTWLLFVVLLIIGLAQLRSRVMTARRVWTISLLLAASGLAGLLYSFRTSPYVNAGTAVWIAVALLGMRAFARVEVRVRPSSVSPDRFEVEGSWIPVGLIVFAIVSRYLATLEIILDPSILRDALFVMGMSAIYGVVSAGFLGRARATSRAIEGSATPQAGVVVRAQS